MDRHVAKALIFDAHDNVLLLRRSETHPLFALETDLPGGIIEHDEDIVDGMVREVEEEAGIKITNDMAVYASEQTAANGTRDILFTVHLEGDKPAVTLSWEHATYTWVAVAAALDHIDTRDEYMDLAKQFLISHLASVA